MSQLDSARRAGATGESIDEEAVEFGEVFDPYGGQFHKKIGAQRDRRSALVRNIKDMQKNIVDNLVRGENKEKFNQIQEVKEVEENGSAEEELPDHQEDYISDTESFQNLGSHAAVNAIKNIENTQKIVSLKDH